MKEVAVVILNWNGKALMEEFLPSVIAYTPTDKADIVVADNGSTDDSVEMLKAKFPEVQLILLDKNYGFAEGYNQALKHIDNKYTVLLNSDVEVTPGWIDAPLNVMNDQPEIAAVQPKILAQRNKKYFEYAGACGGFMDRYGYPYCRGRVLHAIEEDRGQYDMPVDILWATGACHFVRTEVYKKEGGLDGRFFAHQEEVDFCWRLRCRGYRLICTPDSVVYHVGGATLSVESPHKTYLNFRNNLLMVYKNLGEADLEHVMRTRFFLDYLAALKFLLTGHFKNAKAIYKARQDFFELKESYLPIRKENLQKTVLSPIPELSRKSLIVSFYLKGKRKYSDM
ncbi:glycosyltransferase family 2 protein [Massilibacteroides vaginae]|uniref:glycosyltransferase family 2 protein n=1 Tax=Massilibacteroides vaginae TaxID=1673718 RepID=UPI000A1C8CF9|nr:glycosyltransferase family 2 protein [Massilibacteroides vaginae]